MHSLCIHCMVEGNVSETQKCFDQNHKILDQKHSKPFDQNTQDLLPKNATKRIYGEFLSPKCISKCPKDLSKVFVSKVFVSKIISNIFIWFLCQKCPKDSSNIFVIWILFFIQFSFQCLKV